MAAGACAHQSLAAFSSAAGVVVGWAAKDVAHTFFVVLAGGHQIAPGWAIAAYIMYACAVTILVLAAFFVLFRSYVAHVRRQESLQLDDAATGEGDSAGWVSDAETTAAFRTPGRASPPRGARWSPSIVTVPTSTAGGNEHSLLEEV